MHVRPVSKVILLVAVVTASKVHAQGEYLQKGESGIGVQGGYTVNKVGEGFSGSVGYSLLGWFDLDMSVSRMSLRQGLSNFSGQYDFTSVSYSPRVAIHAIKQDTVNNPFSMAFFAGYDWDLYSSEILDRNHYTMKGNEISFGGAAYVNLPTSSTSYFQTECTLGYLIGTVESKDRNGYVKRTVTKLWHLSWEFQLWHIARTWRCLR